MTRMRLLALLLLIVVVRLSAAQQPAQPAPASIEGIVIRQGTNQPVAGVDLELSRVEGTSSAPLGPGVAEAFASILAPFNGLPSQGSTPPAILAPEVKYTKAGTDGRFSFKDLKEGKYRLAAVQVGGSLSLYPAEYGQRNIKQRGLNFPVNAGQALKDLKLEMIPTSAITGQVVDEDGQPLGHIVVLALTMQYRAGEPRPYIERTAITDERGQFRLYWLGPGSYQIAAVYEDPQHRNIEMQPTGPPGRTLARYRATSPTIVRQILPDGTLQEDAYGVVYYGGTTDPRAAAMVSVLAGETFAGADISMGVGKARTHHIRGTVVNGETGQAVNGVQVLAIPRQWSPNALVLSGNSNANGAFDLPGAFPVGYVVTANSGGGLRVDPANGQVTVGTTQVGYVTVDVSGNDANGISLVLLGGINVAGRVLIEGNPSGDTDAILSKMSIGLSREPDLIAMPAPLMPTQAPLPVLGAAQPVSRIGIGQVTGSGDFTLFISPGDFRMSVSGLPANGYVKSIRMGGDDIMRAGFHVTRAPENPLQIIVGMDAGSVSGSVADESLNPFQNATVALVPESSEMRGRPEYYRNAAADSSGSFQLRGIPPGDYKLFAWEWAETDSWQNADFIRAFETLGKSIHIAASGRLDRIQLTTIKSGRAAR